MTVLRFNWDCGQAEVQPLAGMLGPIEFRVPGGRLVQPMAIAPWAGDSETEFESLPGLLKQLRGEWPCVPFGAPVAPDGLPSGWRKVDVEGAGDEFHGYSSHNEWRLAGKPPGGLEIAIDYPRGHAIRRLHRNIIGRPGSPTVDVTLNVEARRDIALPIALHPVFRLPPQVGAAKLRTGGFAKGLVYPIPAEPGVSRFKPGGEFASLGAVPAETGPVSLETLPLEFDTEELVQLCGARGQVSLENRAENYRVTLAYDPAVFPSLLLWVSNRGRKAYPWNGRHLALGVEPVCGAFDLGPAISCSPANPIAVAGYPTAVPLRGGQPFSTTYSIAVEGL